MSRIQELKPDFVEYVPDGLEPGVLYISMRYATAAHLCCCGCGQEVITPLSPIDWQLMFDGRVVSLTPSIGNWSYPCRSHYWIDKNRVRWSRTFSDDEIARIRARDRVRKAAYYRERDDAS